MSGQTAVVVGIVFAVLVALYLVWEWRRDARTRHDNTGRKSAWGASATVGHDVGQHAARPQSQPPEGRTGTAF